MSKFTKFIVGAVAALALFAGASTASAAYTHTVTLKYGSRGSQVMSLQQTLNMTSCKVAVSGAGSMGWETLTFAAKTKAAVMCFQAANGLTADGIVGPMTGSKLMMVTSNGSNSGNFPAGCTSTTGYSPTTGQRCDSGVNTLPAGCTSTAGYSPTTGVKCDGSTSGSNNSNTLKGGAGSVQSYKLLGSPSNNQDVGEGQSNVKVLGFSVQADNSSDLNIKSVKLVLGSVPTATGKSTRFEDYASKVSVWYEGTKVAEASASDFNDSSSNNYSRTLSFNEDAIVRAGATGNFYVAVSGASNIDSGDLNEDWSVDVTQVRFVDAQGAVVTEDPGTADRTFAFKSFATANSVELRLSEANDNPNAMVVKANTANSTNGVVLLKGSIKAVGSDLKIRSVKATITPSGTGDVSEIASQFTLKINGTTIESIDSAACTVAANCNGSTSNTAAIYTFNDTEITVSAGSTVDVVLTADINKVDGTTFVGGDSLSATIDSDNMIARDSSGEDLSTSELNGTLNGNKQTFFTKGIAVTPGTMSATATSQTSANSGTFTIRFSVKAIDQDIYLDKTFASSTSTSSTATGNSRVAITNSAGTPNTTGFSAALSSNDSNSSEQTNTFKVADGQTASFTLTVTANGGSQLERAVLYALEWASTDAATGTNVYTSDMGVDGSYKTNYIYVGL